MFDNFRPHRPTVATTLVVVVLIIVVYHFGIAKRRG